MLLLLCFIHLKLELLILKAIHAYYTLYVSKGVGMGGGGGDQDTKALLWK